MSLSVVIPCTVEQHRHLHYRWYLENPDEETAERYLSAVDQSIRRLAHHPDLGLLRHFQSPEFAGIRSFPAERPFHKHLIFHQTGDSLSIERIMHGARDLPERLMENSGT